MANKLYKTPIVEIAKCAPFHALMISEPKPPTDGGPDLAPGRKIFA